MDKKKQDEYFVEALFKLSSTPEGKFVLKYLEETFRTNEAPFVEDLARASYFSGQKSVIFYIKRKIEDYSK